MNPRLQRWAERRLPALTRYRRPEGLPLELHRRRIYIVPTGFGAAFAVLLTVMLVGALNYANNAALLLTCLLGATSAASMLVAFRTLDGLRLASVRADHVVAGEAVQVQFEFETTRLRQALRLDLGPASTAFAIAAGRTSVGLPLQTAKRGWMPLPRVRVWSSWPLGMFRAWSWLHPQQAVLVWPRAEATGPTPPHHDADQQRHRLHQGDDLAALRDYRLGDPPRHIAWRASARHEHLLVKDFEQPEAQHEWRLDWYQLAGLDDEARIARLARWLDEADRRGEAYSLRLPQQQVPMGSGAQQYAQCMSLLATLP